MSESNKRDVIFFFFFFEGIDAEEEEEGTNTWKVRRT